MGFANEFEKKVYGTGVRPMWEENKVKAYRRLARLQTLLP